MLGSRIEAIGWMANNRAFFSQDAVDRWLADGRIALEGDVLALLPRGPSFRLASAVLFRQEVAFGRDELALCGKVKTLEALSGMSGEHVPGSVVLGDYAYEVQDGFVGDLIEGPIDGRGARAMLKALANGAGS